jgi:hypothetical protein
MPFYKRCSLLDQYWGGEGESCSCRPFRAVSFSLHQYFDEFEMMDMVGHEGTYSLTPNTSHLRRCHHKVSHTTAAGNFTFISVVRSCLTP